MRGEGERGKRGGAADAAATLILLLLLIFYLGAARSYPVCDEVRGVWRDSFEEPGATAGIAEMDNVTVSGGDVRLGLDWAYANWTRRREVRIHNAAGTLTDFQVRIEVPYDDDMRSDFADLRFYYNDTYYNLPYWIESYTAATNATVWVRVPLLENSTSTIYMYYGNPNAESESDIHSTFLWGDDFENATWTRAHIRQRNSLTLQWVSSGVYNMAGLGLAIAELCDDSGALKTFPDSYVVETRVMALCKEGGAYIFTRYDGSWSYYLHTLDIEYDAASLSKMVDGCWTLMEWTPLGYALEPGRWYELRADVIREAATNRLKVHVNDVPYVNRTDGDLAYAGVAFAACEWIDAFHIRFDDFRVRRYAAPEPTAEIGEEEARAACGNVTSVEIAPATLQRWDRFFANSTVPENTSITFSILDAHGNTLIAGISAEQARSGFNISSVAASSIRLHATLTANSPAPALHDWRVTWLVASPAPRSPLTEVADTPDAPLAGEVTTHRITFRTVNPVERGGRVNITFPAGFGLHRTCLEYATYLFDSLSLDALNNTVSLRVAEDIPARAKCTIVLANVKNPLTPGEYAVVVTTLSPDGTAIDRAHSAMFEIKTPPRISTASASIASKLITLLDTLAKSVPESAAESVGNSISELIRLLRSFMRTLQRL